jgi:translocation protein SEC63
MLLQAYKALTDEVARENYKKYGHPDGPQAMSVR